MTPLYRVYITKPSTETIKAVKAIREALKLLGEISELKMAKGALDKLRAGADKRLLGASSSQDAVKAALTILDAAGLEPQTQAVEFEGDEPTPEELLQAKLEATPSWASTPPDDGPANPNNDAGSEAGDPSFVACQTAMVIMALTEGNALAATVAAKAIGGLRDVEFWDEVARSLMETFNMREEA